MNPLYVKTEQKVLESWSEGYQYGKWHVIQETNVTGVVLDRYLNEYSGVEEFTVDATAGDPVYVVSVIYSTGDSFGYKTGELCVVGVYNNMKDAESVQAKILKYPRWNDIRVTLSDGTKEQIYGPWAGFFERIQNVRLEKFIVENRVQ